MTTSQCWTLWQSMPPRYQLSAKEFIVQHPEWKPALDNNATLPAAEAYCPVKTKVSFSGIAPHSHNENLRARVESRSQAFPVRTSVYIRNLKHQKRVNSARQRIMDDPTVISYTPLIRAHTTPQIPLTNLANLESFDDFQNQEDQKPQRASLSVKNIAPFLSTSPKNKIKGRMKQYVVTPSDNAVMYIDNDKILYFRNNKPDITQLFKTEENYIAHLRKEFLNRATAARVESDGAVKAVVKERIDYDRRVGHILDYYEKGDISWFKKHEKATDNETSEPHEDRIQSARTASGTRTSRSCQTPRRTKSSRSARLRSLLAGPDKSSQTRATCLEEDWQTYLKMNVQSILHGREFLPETPDGHGGVNQMECSSLTNSISCECRMCRLEMLSPSPQIPPKICFKEEHREISKMLNDQPLLVSGGGGSFSLNLETEDSSLNTKAKQADTEESADTTNGERVRECRKKEEREKGSREKEKKKKEKRDKQGKEKVERDKKEWGKGGNEERESVKEASLKDEKWDEVGQEEEWEKEQRKKECSWDEEIHRDAEYISITLPDIQEISKDHAASPIHFNFSYCPPPNHSPCLCTHRRCLLLWPPVPHTHFSPISWDRSSLMDSGLSDPNQCPTADVLGFNVLSALTILKCSFYDPPFPTPNVLF
ncbi:uncharacterized protein LOC121384759 [Gigantopelta aegis]|uniref:uncharacterized protein LOC121384759 n=1 Tax=Gigantopelta aegis TaxID=1735272 RepID=UPI001B8876AD|nr:uncharacterized protein LOC121384759 [Gigantopelta aegis]